jgi:aminoglycoside 3-N-acetyltransferase
MSPQRSFEEFLEDLECRAGNHVVVHSSFRSVRSAFPDLTIEELIGALQSAVTSSGSILIPAFTYCLKQKSGSQRVFARETTPSEVGAVSEVFRGAPGVVRTSSPTHSFGLWGCAAEELTAQNCPASPLGEGSPMDWLAAKGESRILLLGTDFSSLSFCHYLEIMAPVPWYDYFPWEHLGLLPIGMTVEGEVPLREVPGCSKGFVALERHLLARGSVRPVTRHGLRVVSMAVPVVLEEGLRFLRSTPELVLCPRGSCAACDSRRKAFVA